MPDFLAEALTWPKNYYNAVAVETAVKMGLPPTSFLTDEQPSKSWSREDKKLAIAWHILQRETCSKCGNPLWICRSSNNMLGFSVRRGVCYASKELAKEEKAAEKNKSKQLKDGEFHYTVPTMLDGSDLPSRLDYFESLDDE